MRSETRQALLANDQETLYWENRNPQLMEKFVLGSELSWQDQFRLSNFFAVHLRNREFEYSQYLAGALDERTWFTYKELIAVLFGSERGRRWWETVGRHGPFDDSFILMVDEILVSAPDNIEFLRDWGRWDLPPNR